MSASGSESNVADQNNLDDVDAQAWSDDPDGDEATPMWATVQYEEGTSGPLKVVEGLLVDDANGITVLNPETGLISIISERSLVRADVEQVEVEDEGEGSDDE